MVSPSPAVPPRRPKGFVVGLVVGLLVASAVGLAIYVGSRGTRPGQADSSSVTPSPSLTPSPSPNPSPEPASPPTLVRNTFNEAKSPSVGGRLSFESYWMDPPHFPESGCTTHTYTYKSKTHGAFESDCSDWESRGYDILIFFVGVRNISDQAVTLHLRDFVLQSRDGRTFGPVNVRSNAAFPTSFLSETQKLPPKARWVGYVTFDGRVTGMVPASISYIDGKQTLKQIFHGNAAVQ